MKSVQALVLSIVLFLMAGVGQVFAGHPADPSGELINYSLYGQDRLRLTANAITATGGKIGSKVICDFVAPKQLIINGDLSCINRLKYGGYNQPGGQGSLILEEDVLVGGNVEGGVALYKKNLTRGGSITGLHSVLGVHSNSAPTITTPELPTFNSINTSGVNQTYPWGGSLSLNPGNYGHVVVPSGTLTLNASDSGIYHFKSLTINNNGRIRIVKNKSQTVRILVKGRIKVDNLGKIVTSEASDYGKVLLYSSDSVTINSSTQIDASIVAPFKGVYVDHSVTLNGQILAKRIWNKNANFNGNDGKFVAFNPVNVQLVAAATYEIPEDSDGDTFTNNSRPIIIPIELKSPTLEAASVDYEIRAITNLDSWGGSGRRASVGNTANNDLIYGINGAGPNSGTLNFDSNATTSNEEIKVWINDDDTAETVAGGIEYFALILKNPNVIVFDVDPDAVFRNSNSLIYLIKINSEDASNQNPTDITTSTSEITEGSKGDIILSNNDPDGDAALSTYTIVSQAAGSNTVLISGSTLSLQNNAVYEQSNGVLNSNNPITVEVEVTDQAGGTYVETLTLTITNTNDEKPWALPDALTVIEGASGTVEISTNDTDGVDKMLLTSPTYSLVGPNGGALYSSSVTIAGSEITYNHDGSETILDTVWYNLNDGGIDLAKDDSISYVVITITQTNDNAPLLVDAAFNVSEGEANDFVVTTLVATDVDLDHAPLTYQIIEHEHVGAFKITSDGIVQIENTDSVDFELDEIHIIKVEVSDGTRLDTATITINIDNINDSAPTISNTSFTIQEDIASLTLIAQLLVSDADASLLTFTLIGQPVLNAFAVDASGQLSVVDGDMIDYESRQTHTLDVQVSDGVFTVNSTVTINVTDVNDNLPIYSDISFNIDEDIANGVLVGTHAATDLDTDTLSYQIIAEDYPGTFAIDSLGQITVLNNSSIDYEADPIQLLTIQVSDGLNTVDVTVTVNIQNLNDNIPVLTDISYTISESSPNGSNVGSLLAIDADGDLDILYYSIKTHEYFGAFNLNSVTGALTVSNTNLIDYETDPIHLLTVEVTDGFNTVEAQVTVNITNVNDNLPQIADKLFEVDEDEVNGYVVGSLSASDADNDALTMFISSQSYANAFAITPGGEIRVMDDTQLDFESDESHTLSVGVFDVGDTVYATVIIQLVDVNDNLPSVNSDTIYVTEAANPTHFLTFVVGVDLDKNDSFIYSITSGNTDSDLTIDVVNGRLTTQNRLDFETKPQYDLVITAVSNGDTVLSSMVIIVNNVNVPPIITADTLNIDENTLRGTIATGNVTAEDEDSSVLTWSLPGDTLFLIDSLTGVITLKNDSTLNFELSEYINVIFMVADDSGSTLKNVTIRLGDVNDAPVIDNQVIQIEENQPGGTVIGTITSTDEDAGSVATYSLIDSTKFVVDPATGDLMVREGVVLDFEDQKTYFLDVIVTDGEFADTNKTIVSLINVVEVAEIEIVKIFDESGRSVEGVDEFFTSDDSVTIVYDKGGVLDTIKYSVEEGLNRLQESNDDVTMDIHEKARAEVTVSKVIPILVIVVDSTVPLDTADNVYYINDTEDSIIVQITYVNEDLETITFDSLIATNEFAKEGKELTRTIFYEDPYGNINEIDVTVILDTTPPLLVILTPEHKSKHSTLELDVQWFTDDDGVLDTLNNIQLVSQGLYPITRSYTDFAGNSVSVTHVVTIKAAAAGAQIKIVDQVIEQKSNEEILEYFEKKERDTDPGLKNIKLDKDGDGIPDIELANLNVILPVHNSRSIENLTAVEIGIQTSEGLVKRQNLTEFDYYRNKGLIGPTLELTLHFPINGGYSASDSLREGSIPDSLRAACGQDSTMFKLKIDGITFFVFDHLGQYVTKVRFTGFDLSDPRYQDDKGKVTLALELPQLESGMKSEYGTNWGAGVYIFNGLINTSATPRACLSHIETIVKRTSKTTLLERVGYQRNDK